VICPSEANSNRTCGVGVENGITPLVGGLVTNMPVYVYTTLDAPAATNGTPINTNEKLAPELAPDGAA
jgi:hypothetical protein